MNSESRVFSLDYGIAFLRKHGGIIAIACIVGALSIAPHMLASRSLEGGYQGYPFMYQANEDIYMARIQEIIDGYPLVGSPILYEYKNEWPPVVAASEQLYALPSIVLDIPLRHTIVASKFLLPAVLFLLIYALVFSLTRVRGGRISYWSAVAAGITVTLGYDIIDYAHLPALLSNSLGQTTLPVWTRPVNPISGALILFSLILIVWNILTKRTRWWAPLLGGLLLGVSIAYFFSWFLGGVIVGLSLLYAAYTRQWRAALQLAAILCVSLIVQIPHWYHMLASWGTEAGRLLQTRNGGFFTHDPIVNKFLLAASLVFVLCLAFSWYKQRSLRQLEFWWWFCALLLTACWIAFNEQLITGLTIWPYHFVQYTIPLGMVVLFVVGCNYIAPYFPRLFALSLALTISTSLAVGVASAQSYRYQHDDFSVRQTHMPIFAWLNDNAPKDCVVLVDEPTDLVATSITAFTHCNSYTTTYVPFNVPQERLVHTLYTLMRLRGVAPADSRAYLESHPGLVNGLLYTSIDQSLFTGINDETRNNIDMLVHAYDDFYKADFVQTLKKYRIDYVLTVSDEHMLETKLPLEEVATSGTLTLYTIQ